MTQKMCDKAVSTYPTTIKCVLAMIYDSRNGVIKQLMDVFLDLLLFLIHIKPM